MKELLKKPKIIFLIAMVLISVLSIAINGIGYGIEFEGGTMFQVQLDEKATPEKMEIITSIISQRLDAFGLKDTKVNSLGDDLIAAQIAETDPQKIEQLESLLKTQARFEATIDGNILFEGSSIKQVFKDASHGYGAYQSSETQHSWSLPFLLSQQAAESFSKGVFHRCTATGFDPNSGTSYECQDTFFFIDRPLDSVIIIPSAVLAEDNELLFAGNLSENIPQGMSFDNLMYNSGLEYIVVSEETFTESQIEQLKEIYSATKKAVIHPDISSSQRTSLEEIGFRINEVKNDREFIPWIWGASGARQIISITPGIANLDPYVENISNAKIFSSLSITGGAPSMEEANQELKQLQILLETGSLPIGIKSISKETISPLLGKEFLSTTLLIGLASLAMVALVIFVRYRKIKLVLPILLTGLSEIVIIAGIISLLSYRLDLAGVAGILAAVGTGVDDQIVITDELMRGEKMTGGSYFNRIKKAFFIIFAAAATTIVTMLPIIIFGFGFGKLVGFAITTIIGVLVGVFISRPAFSVIAEEILKSEEE